MEKSLSTSAVDSFGSSRSSLLSLNHYSGTRRSSATTTEIPADTLCPKQELLSLNFSCEASAAELDTPIATPPMEAYEREKFIHKSSEEGNWFGFNDEKQFYGDLTCLGANLEGTERNDKIELNTDDLWDGILEFPVDHDKCNEFDVLLEGRNNDVAEEKIYMPYMGCIEDAAIPNLQPPSPRAFIIGREMGHTLLNPVQLGDSLLETFLTQDDSGGEEDIASLRIELRRVRVEVFRLREKLQTVRQDLRNKENAKIAAGDAFMKHVRGSMQVPATLPPDMYVVSDLSSKLTAYYSAMQEARDEYGPLDAEYNALLETLDDREFSMARLESRVLDKKVPSISDRESLSTTSRANPFWEENGYHPLHLQYLSRLGDLYLAMEELYCMNEDYESLLHLRDTPYAPFDSDMEAFLEQFPVEKAGKEREISDLEADVEVLRARCLGEGIDLEADDVSSNTESNEASLPDADNFNTHDTLVAQKENANGDNSFHILLSTLDNRHDELFGDLITNFDEHNKNDRINRWLLYSL